MPGPCSLAQGTGLALYGKLKEMTTPSSQSVIRIMEVFVRSGGRAYGSQICKQTGLTNGSVYTGLGQMVNAGWIFRTTRTDAMTEYASKGRSGKPPLYYQLTPSGVLHAQANGISMASEFMERWFHDDGTECAGGGSECLGECVDVHSPFAEIARLRKVSKRALAREEFARKLTARFETLDHHREGVMKSGNRLAMNLGAFLYSLEQMEKQQKGVGSRESVFIAESVFIEDNPWDGRTRHGVCASLELALEALAMFSEKDDPLETTPYPGAVDDQGEPTRWRVHRRSEPFQDGVLWIFREEMIRKRTLVEEMHEVMLGAAQFDAEGLAEDEGLPVPEEG